MYIFIMCYVHILQYGTATIHGNATQSRLHGFRVRPQRSGTVVQRHNMGVYSIHLWLHRHNRTWTWSENTVNANLGQQWVLIAIQYNTDGRMNRLRMDFQPREKEILYDIFFSGMVGIMFLFRLLLVLSGWLRRLYPKTPAGQRLARP